MPIAPPAPDKASVGSVAALLQLRNAAAARRAGAALAPVAIDA